MSPRFPLSHKVPEAVIEKTFEKAHLLLLIGHVSAVVAAAGSSLPVCLLYFDLTSSSLLHCGTSAAPVSPP